MIKRLYFSVFTLLLMALSLCSCNQDALKALKLSHESITLAIGSSITLEVIHIPIEATPNNKVSWKSSNPNVARVDSRGKVTPLYTGTTVITAYCGTIEAKCTVTVSSLNYDVQFSHAMAYIYGDQDDVAANHVILRLFQESLSVDATGTITGQGIFLNIDLYLPFDKDVIPTGIYSCSELPLLNTCLQGALLEVGDAAYATGTYLGEFHENGLGALFLTQGQIDVTAQDGQYIIKVELTGDRAEKVNTLYQGAITFVDNSDEEELETVDYLVEAIHYFNYGDRDSLGLNVARMQIFNREGHMIRLDAYVPLAIKDTLPKIGRAHV